MSVFLNLIFWLISLPTLLSCSYLLLLTLFSSKMRLPSAPARTLRFDVIVPAHDEEILIGRAVDCLLRMDWPQDRFRVLVVADNCADQTASIARAAGAEVLERRHDRMRGKGYALEHAFQASATTAWADAVVVIDADSEVSGNLLTALAARIERGAHAVQVHYGVLEPRTSWRTRLLCIALAAFHRLRSRGRERLQLSCGFRGNGWCVTQALLNSVPYRAFSLAEDIEYGIDLGLAGYRVHYADEASVDAEMAADAEAARTQRQRWEHGRWQLIRTRTAPLLRAALRQRSAICLDLAIDLMVLPLSYVALSAAGVIASGAVLLIWRPDAMLWLWLGVACAASLTLYVLRGWQLSRMGVLGLVDLARAPFYMAWKILLMLQPRASLAWVRTRRRAE